MEDVEAKNGGVIVEGKMTNNMTALHLACYNNYLEVVWFLLRRYPWLGLDESISQPVGRKRQRIFKIIHFIA